MPATHIVIGSGPAGVACAKGLLARGARVHMVDAGIELEAPRAQIVRQLAMVPPAQWRPEQIAVLKEGNAPSGGDIPTKRVYGSDFPYRDADKHVPVDYHGVGLRPSLAFGGLSTVWGAAMLPYLERDIADWPVPLADLTPHYQAVADFTGLCARQDGLDDLFPRYVGRPGQLEPSRQAATLLRALDAHRTELHAAGIYHGQARVAIKPPSKAPQSGCVYCGLCMFGCPYRFIYSSVETLRELQSEPAFNYQGDVIVTAVRESDVHARVEGYHRITGQPIEIEAERVYLAAGAIPSTAILLRSMGAYERTIHFRDSQYFLLPLVQAHGARGVRNEPLHTLSQVFLEILDARVSPRTVHLQIYSYSELIAQALRKSFGPLARPLDFVARVLEGRLLVVQGFLHSSDSNRIAVTLHRGETSRQDRLELNAEIEPTASQVIGRTISKLLQNSRCLGAMPLSPMLQVAEPGRGFHTGASFPMRARPGPFESDTLGRPSGWRRLHVVDATVLPGIPGTTITFSVMANARRIGWDSATGDV